MGTLGVGCARWAVRAGLALCLGCGGGGGGPADEAAGRLAVSLARAAAASALPSDLTRVRATCTASDLTAPIRGDVPLDGAPLVLTVPVGPDRLLTLDAYAGPVHRMAGSVTVPYVFSGVETPVTVTLVDLATLSLTPASATLAPGATQPFAVSVTHQANTSATWSVAGVAGGNASVGTVSADGVYTAPVAVPAPPTVALRVTSVADPTLWAEATVTIVTGAPDTTPPIVAASRSGGTYAPFTLTLSATDDTDPAPEIYYTIDDRPPSLDWTAYAGGIALTGGTQTLRFFAADASENWSAVERATYTIEVPPISVTVSPGAPRVVAGETVALSATVSGSANAAVTWSVTGTGAIDGAGVYSAPATVPTPTTVTVRASSVADPATFDEVTLTVVDPAAAGLTAWYSTGAVLLEAPVFHGWWADCGATGNNLYQGICTPIASSPVNWAWGTGFDVSWAGWLHAPVAGQYHFSSNYWVDGVVRIEVGGVVVADLNTPGGGYSGTVTLVEGARVPVAMTFRPNGGSNNMHLGWVQPGGAWEPVPAAYLEPEVAVTVSPAVASVEAGASRGFSATVTGTANPSVTWSVEAGTCGVAAGSIDAAGVYTAGDPAVACSATVRATSVADSTSSATGAVTVQAVPTPVVTVSVSPVSVTLAAGGQQVFGATVTGTGNASVTWSVEAGTCGVAAGSIDAVGRYTAANPAVNCTESVRATSAADPTASATAVVTVLVPVVVNIVPSTWSLVHPGSITFNASVTGATDPAVTWSMVSGSSTCGAGMGSIDPATGSYTTGNPSLSCRDAVRATSDEDPTSFATATVDVTVPLSVTLAGPVTVDAGAQARFTATITGTANTAVTWYVDDVAGGDATLGTIAGDGTYTAPPWDPARDTFTVKAVSAADGVTFGTSHVQVIVATCLGGYLSVNSTNDTVDDVPGDGICSDVSGSCTLRAAVQEANACPGADVIDVRAGTYVLTLLGVNEDAATTGDLDITDDLSVRGVGAGATVIDGNGLDRVFHGIGPVPVTLVGSTIQNGSVSGYGGGVLAGGDLTITSAVLTGNHATNHGGAVCDWGPGTIIVANSTLSGNTSDSYGGAVFGGAGVFVGISDSTLSANVCGSYGAAVYGHTGSTIEIARSVLDGNTGLDGNTAGWAAVVGMGAAAVRIADSTISNSGTGTDPARSTGGVRVYTDSTMTITRSTITGNRGGGVSCSAAYGATCAGLTVTDSAIDGNSGTAVGSYSFDGPGVYTTGPTTVTGSSISGNRVIGSLAGTGAGGGIWASGDLTVVNSTISGNSIPNNAVGGAIYFAGTTGTISNATLADNYALYGPGVWIQNSAATLTVTNSILTGPWTGHAGNCTVGGGVIASGGHNIDSGNTCGFAVAGDLVNTDPLLNPLADNGGLTLTRGLADGSPAVDAGDHAVCAAAPVNGVDQRGAARGDGACDIGAFEGAVPFLACLGVELTVNSTADAVDAALGDRLCADADGKCTLRAAIQEANACRGRDVIRLPEETYVLALPGSEDAAAGGDLDINDGLTLAGEGAASTIIDGGGLDRVFHVRAATPWQVTISGVTVTGGAVSVTDGGGIYNTGLLELADVVVSGNTAVRVGTTGGNAGGIYNSGTLTVTGSTVRGNSAHALSSGGGIYNSAGAVTVTDSTIESNAVGVYGTQVQGTGGGIYSDGTLQVANSVIRGNWAHGGGGIAARNAVTIVDSTVSGNRAWYISQTSSGHGGGIYLWDGTVRIDRSTVSGNSAIWSSVGGYGGGGLYNETADVSVVNSTISGNEGSNGMVGGLAHRGGTLAVVNSTVTANTGGVGGIFRGGGAVTLANSIVADQTSGTDCGGAITSSGHNLDGDGSCGLTAPGDLLGSGASLGPLADNGGPTWTHALLAGSKAIDAGDAAVCAAGPVGGADQRGAARPVDGDGDGAPTCDIGAFEYP